MRFLRDLLVMAGSLVIVAALAAQTPEADLQRAIQKEVTTGDLAAAIADYQRIAQRAGSNPAVAARALLRLAEAHQKRGDAEARKVYERIVRDFAGQTEVASVARARLSGTSTTSPTASTVNRQIWTGPKVGVFGTVSPDGRHLSFVDWESGELGIHDLATGTDRLITDDGPWDSAPDFAEESVISPDGSQIAYAWYADRLARYQLRLGRVDQPANATPRIVVDDPDIGYIAPFSWSPDGAFVSVAIMRAQRVNQVALVRMRDGAITVLKTIERGGLERVLFSPDGRWVAYDATPDGGASGSRDVYVVSAGGGADAAIAAHPAHETLVGWSTGGDHLLFASNRSGTTGLWAVPMREGRAAGPVVFVKEGAMRGMGVTRAGMLVYGFQSSAVKIYTAAVDFATGRLVSAPKEAAEAYLSSHRNPRWSPDGTRLAFTVQGMNGRATSLAILTLATGRLEQVELKTTLFDRLRWPTEDMLICNCADVSGQGGVYRLDPKTGQPSPLARGGGNFLSHAAMTPDGRTLFFTRSEGIPPRQRIIARDLSSGAERELVADALAPSVSPDGRSLAYLTRSPSNLAAAQIHLMPIAGGPSRFISEAAGVNPLLEWTPDGRALIFNKTVASKLTAVARPIAGGADVVLDLPADRRPPTLSVHPDGRQIAFGAGTTSFEVWTLENFLKK